MPFNAWPDGAMAVFQYAGTLGTWTNRLAFVKPNFTLTDQQTLSSVLEAALRTSFKNKLADAVTFYGVDVIDMRAFGAPSYVSSYAGAPGLNVTDELPPSTCVVVTLRTALRGRAFRGRVYLAGFAEDQLTNGVWEAACTTECLDQLGAWQSVANTTGWGLNIATQWINKVHQVPAEMTPVTSMEVRSARPGHQRRRDRRP